MLMNNLITIVIFSCTGILVIEKQDKNVRNLFNRNLCNYHMYWVHILCCIIICFLMIQFFVSLMLVLLSQVMQLCEVLQEAPHVRVLHLPHLACGLEGLQAVARLVEINPLMSLNLAGSLSSGTPVSSKTRLLLHKINLSLNAKTSHSLI